MKIVQYLEQLFRYRVDSNDKIPSYIKKLTVIGKMDEPKKNEILGELLLRVAKLEEKLDLVVESSFVTTTSTKTDSPVVTLNLDIPPEEATPVVTPKQENTVSWSELRKIGKEMGIYKVGQTKDELTALIDSKK